MCEIEIQDSPEKGWNHIKSDFLPNVGTVIISPKRTKYFVEEVVFDDDENKAEGCTIMLRLALQK
jgi:hypothetical protein